MISRLRSIDNVLAAALLLALLGGAWWIRQAKRASEIAELRQHVPPALTNARLVAVHPADLRCGADRLLVKVRDELGCDVRDGNAYAFRNRTCSRMKVVYVDAQGVWVCTRRLHAGAFHWPRMGETACALTPEQFAWLCAGVEWQRLSRAISSLPHAV